MKYTYPTSEYLKQLKTYNEFERLSFTPNDSKEYVLFNLEERSKKKRLISDVINTMVFEYVETFEKNPETITKEDVAKLEELYQILQDPKTHRDLDLGVMLRIVVVLKNYYKSIHDTHNYVRLLKECVIEERLLIFNHSDTYSPSVFIQECQELCQRYDDLSNEDKAIIYNALYWLYLNHEDDFGADDRSHPVDLFIPIDAFLQERVKIDGEDVYEKTDPLGIAHNSLNLILEHFSWMNRHHRKVDVERLRPLMERFTKTLEEQHLNNPSYSMISKLSTISTLHHAYYLLGKITAEQLLDKVAELADSGIPEEGAIAQITRLAKFNYHYLFFLYRYSGYPKEKIIAISQKRIKEALPKILNISREINNSKFNLYLLLFIIGASYTSRFEEFSQLILELTVYSNKALYVHTEMVKELSLVIFDYIIEHNPAFFAGVSKYNAQYIIDHKEEMRHLLAECCMYHDVGKFYMLDIVDNSMRKLTDEEFKIIKAHPLGFDEFSRNWIDVDERLICIRDCALNHHLWHDGSNGYPHTRHTYNRPFVDILSIADSIDAATDIYGRPYRTTKSLNNLIDEFNSGAGTRYGSEPVEALKDKEVKEKLQHLITEGRKEIYYQIYAFNKVNKQ